MPGASTALCVECETQRSKYTCPACKARTCSLACTKLHKSSSARQPCSAPAPASCTTLPTAASCASSLRPTGALGASDGSGGGLGYVPMSEYSESHLLKDYLFLSSISRTAAETGRRIVSLNLLPPSTTASSSDTNQAKHTQHPNNAGAPRLTNQQRQREQLIKQLHYRKYKVMVLPEGMARRKQNLSAFNAKDRKFHLSVELKFAAEAKTNEMVVHKQPAERSIQEVVLNELQHRSFGNKKELAKLSKPAKAWVVSSSVLEQVGLPVPEQAEKREGREEGESLLVLKRWPEREWAVVVPAYSARLTNESTARYLDWWTRKRRWEEANPELAAQQQQQLQPWQQRPWGLESESRPRYTNDLEPEIRDESTGYHLPQEQASASADATHASNPPDPVGGGGGGVGGIVSSSLLSLLSQRLGRTSCSATTEPTTDVATPAGASDSHQAGDRADGGEAEDHEESMGTKSRSILVRIGSPASVSLDWLLRHLPDGYSVVELPQIHIVRAGEVEELCKSSRALMVDLDSPEVSEVHNKEEDPVKRTQSEKVSPSTVTVVPSTSGSLGALLGGYDSDSDSEEQQSPQKQEPEHEGNPAASLAHLASMHGFLPQPASPSSSRTPF